MGLDFKLFEITSHKDVEIHTEHTIEEVGYFSNSKGMLLAEWFYRKNGRLLHDNINESYYYVKCSADDLLDIKGILKYILDTDDVIEQKLLALNYFPTTYAEGYYVSSVEMFSEEYFNCLRGIYEKLSEIIPSDNLDNRERLFLYNISW